MVELKDLKEDIMHIIESELPLVDCITNDNGEVRYRIARSEIVEDLKKAEARVDSNNVPQYLIDMVMSGWKLVYDLDDIVSLYCISSYDNGFDLYITSSRQITVTCLGISLGEDNDAYLIKFRKDNIQIVNYQNDRSCRTYDATIRELADIIPIRIFEAVLKHYTSDYSFCDDMIKTGFYPPVKIRNLSKFAELCS